MAIIDGFKIVEDESTLIKGRPFITLRNRMINFSKDAVKCLHYAEYVHMYLDENGKRVAFVPCKKEANAILFYKQPAEGKQAIVRISDVKKARMVMQLAGIDDCGKGIRFYGKYIPEEDTLLFDVSKE